MDPATTVLLAEDNPDEAVLMQHAFKSCGLMRPAHVAHDGAQAIAYMAGEGPFADRVEYPFPNLIILDLKMPGTSGFEVLEWLKNHPELTVIPTIVWSSSADPRDVKRAYCLGANGYLCKPIDFQEFKAMVSDILRYWDRCLKPQPDAKPSCDELNSRTPFAGVHG